MIGGFYLSTAFSSRIRYMWLGIIAGLICVSFGLEICLIISLIMGNKDYGDTSSAIALHGSFSGIPAMAIIFYIMRHFQKQLEWGLFQNEDLEVEMESLKRKNGLENMKNMIYCSFFCMVACVGILIMHIVYSLLNANSVDELKNSRWQMFPNPFTRFIETEVDFICITTVIFIPISIMFFGLCDGLFTIALAEEYYWSMAVLWMRMEKFSKESTINIENLSRTYLGSNEISCMESSDYLNVLEAERERLIENIKSTVYAYQKQIE
ncbi:hypothetical protein V9T40_003718 [Parthenolecanium corni]|uniref:Uncharacterized protein n=1 Tax=Parthenolecanium corni TaxID=536013 RepID=A0AAN9U1D5_9HEMI